MSFKYRLAGVCFVGLAIAARPASAGFGVNILINIGSSNGVADYNAAAAPTVFPSTPGSGFTTGLISSADGEFITQTQGPNEWQNEATSTQFNSIAALMAALEQPWTITLDQGLHTQRQYTTTINLGALPTTDTTPAQISYPANHSTITTVTPTFTFTTPPEYNFLIYLDQETSPDGGALLDLDQIPLPSGVTTFTAPNPLAPDSSFIFSLFANNIDPAGLGFSTPVDASDNPMPEWSGSVGSLQFDTTAAFSTPVPEPASVALFAAGSVYLFKRRR
jgi:hypothetical protein